jgi:predicted RNase H-like HicB family nuclease/uncharacterized damage-inducible protein DinB
MPRYEVYLEIHADGRTMAHVPALPGCVARGPNRQEALRYLPEAVQAHHAWLRRHDENAPADHILAELVIVEERGGIGAFDRREVAALLPTDLARLGDDDLTRHLRLLGYSRADLLALVKDLPDEVLDWNAGGDPGSIRSVLQHVAAADLWYLSRIFGPAELDRFQTAAMPVFDLLDQTRSYALDRWRNLSKEQRAKQFTPLLRSGAPDEPWTCRKALRRALEHELEHTNHINELQAAWRTHLVARLQYARADVLDQLTGLTMEDLTRKPVFDTTSAANILAHIASWDEFFAERLAAIRENRLASISGVEVDKRNAQTAEQCRNWSLDRSLSAFLLARRALLGEFDELSLADLHRPLPMPWGQPTVYRWIEICIEHDEEHAGHLREWRKTLGEAAQATWRQQGPKSLLASSLHAWREALLAWMAFVPPQHQETLPVVESWTLKDLAGHIADWDGITTEILRSIHEQREPVSDYDGDTAAWNAKRAAARAGDSWDACWGSLRKARHDVLAALEPFDDERLVQPYEGSLGGDAYGWVYTAVEHDRDHTEDIRRTITSKG